MEYELFLYSALDADSIREIIVSYMNKILLDEVNFHDEKDILCISHKYFTMFIDKQDDEGIDITSDMFKMDLNISIDIQIFGKTFDKGLYLIFKIINTLLIDSTCNMLLLQSGEIEILRKQGTELSFIQELDQYQKKYLSNKYFDLLVYPK